MMDLMRKVGVVFRKLAFQESNEQTQFYHVRVVGPPGSGKTSWVAASDQSILLHPHDPDREFLLSNIATGKQRLLVWDINYNHDMYISNSSGIVVVVDGGCAKGLKDGLTFCEIIMAKLVKSRKSAEERLAREASGEGGAAAARPRRRQIIQEPVVLVYVRGTDDNSDLRQGDGDGPFEASTMLELLTKKKMPEWLKYRIIIEKGGNHEQQARESLVWLVEAMGRTHEERSH